MSNYFRLVKMRNGGSAAAAPGGATLGSIGALESIKASISHIFPSVQWVEAPGLPGMQMEGWRGIVGRVEFLVAAWSADEVPMMAMFHCDRSEAERVADALGLVVLDDTACI